ncbi:MAG: hypothetical protein Q8P55_00140 [bacterium]|nr:hypothetical protein [bacterium]
MKKVLFLVLVLSFLFGGALGVAAQAEAGPCDAYCTALNAGASQQELSGIDTQGRTCICNPLQAEGLSDVITPILDFLFNIALVLTPVMVVVAGIMFVTATGDPAKVSRAKQMLIWTAVGFGIIVLAKGLIVVLRTIIGF